MSKERIDHIVIRAPNWVGDSVMCTPALMDVREYFTNATIVLWARPAIAEMLQDHPALDRVLVYDDHGEHAGFGGKLRFIRELRSFHFQLAILFQNAFEAAFLTRLAGIPHRWGYATDGRRVLLSKPIAVSHGKRGTHQVHYYQNLVEQAVGRSSVRNLHLQVSAKDEMDVDERFPELVSRRHEYIVGLNPGAMYGSSKRWLPERFAELADRLMAQLPRAGRHDATVKCIIVGGAHEEKLAHTIASLMKVRPTVLSGQTTLRELMVLIKRCALFVTNDTGPMHIAAALDVPLVAIFGSTDPRHTSPFGMDDAVVSQPVRCSPCFLRSCPIDHRCMTQVSVEQALDMAMQQVRATVMS
ncbi:MAG: lipopolysaccharide heptosyltransferase II [Nitrospirales bacterium]|nr:lipopolysaccharide heptosyltransferase II [Nitrospira sp.]MDR4502397.1 lipopolysaccharide heptosyltransferase II [Nitrospirales bacterium]